ncbi:MAG: hypothetical protein C5B58_01455 [Acidobacteria bacterium]|nr:MAG: hypothetical protein C5B58_01455 [Acidobacteriota bacterium]
MTRIWHSPISGRYLGLGKKAAGQTRDLNQRAKAILDAATAGKPQTTEKPKGPAAVGRKGGGQTSIPRCREAAGRSAAPAAPRSFRVLCRASWH